MITHACIFKLVARKHYIIFFSSTMLEYCLVFGLCFNFMYFRISVYLCPDSSGNWMWIIVFLPVHPDMILLMLYNALHMQKVGLVELRLCRCTKADGWKYFNYIAKKDWNNDIWNISFNRWLIAWLINRWNMERGRHYITDTNKAFL